jgi:hypothetical protein
MRTPASAEDLSLTKRDGQPRIRSFLQRELLRRIEGGGRVVVEPLASAPTAAASASAAGASAPVTLPVPKKTMTYREFHTIRRERANRTLAQLVYITLGLLKGKGHEGADGIVGPKTAGARSRFLRDHVGSVLPDFPDIAGISPGQVEKRVEAGDFNKAFLAFLSVERAT